MKQKTTVSDFLDSAAALATPLTGVFGAVESGDENAADFRRRKRPKLQRVESCRTRHTALGKVEESGARIPAAVFGLFKESRAGRCRRRAKLGFGRAARNRRGQLKVHRRRWRSRRRRGQIGRLETAHSGVGEAESIEHVARALLCAQQKAHEALSMYGVLVFAL